jgi:hypothetical protein
MMELGPVEQRKLIALGYLSPSARGSKGEAYDAALVAFVSDALAEESVGAA